MLAATPSLQAPGSGLTSCSCLACWLCWGACRPTIMPSLPPSKLPAGGSDHWCPSKRRGGNNSSLLALAGVAEGGAAGGPALPAPASSSGSGRLPPPCPPNCRAALAAAPSCCCITKHGQTPGQFWSRRRSQAHRQGALQAVNTDMRTHVQEAARPLSFPSRAWPWQTHTIGSLGLDQPIHSCKHRQLPAVPGVGHRLATSAKCTLPSSESFPGPALACRKSAGAPSPARL